MPLKTRPETKTKSRMMKLTLVAALLGTAALSGCSIATWESAQNSSGLLEFATDPTGSSGSTVPVEIARNGSGRIAVAHARADRDRKDLLVSGSARPRAGEEWRDHVDVSVIGPDRQILDTAVAKFSYTGSRSRLSGLSRSRYAVSLPGVPPKGSVVLVSYHADSIHRCPNYLL